MLFRAAGSRRRSREELLLLLLYRPGRVESALENAFLGVRSRTDDKHDGGLRERLGWHSCDEDPREIGASEADLPRRIVASNIQTIIPRFVFFFQST